MCQFSVWQFQARLLYDQCGMCQFSVWQFQARLLYDQCGMCQFSVWQFQARLLYDQCGMCQFSVWQFQARLLYDQCGMCQFSVWQFQARLLYDQCGMIFMALSVTNTLQWLGLTPAFSVQLTCCWAPLTFSVLVLILTRILMSSLVKPVFKWWSFCITRLFSISWQWNSAGCRNDVVKHLVGNDGACHSNLLWNDSKHLQATGFFSLPDFDFDC